MKVIVENVGVWKKSKYSDGRNKRVTLTPIVPHSEKYVYLNMTDYERVASGQTVAEYWNPAIKAGNVLDVNLLGEALVNKFGQYTLIKEVKGEN